MALRDLLDWEESVFRGLLGGWRRLGRTRAAAERADAAVLADHARSLTVLAQLLTGEPLRVREAPGVGGLRGGDLLLPARMAISPEPALNAEAYRVQVVALAGMRRALRGRRPPLATRYEGALEGLRLARTAVEEMARELPGFRPLHDRVMACVLAGRRAPPRLGAREAALEEARREALRGEAPWDDAALRACLVGPRTGRHRSPPLAVWGEAIESLDGGPLEAPGDTAARTAEEPTSEVEAPAVGGLRYVEIESDEEPRDTPPGAPFERAETLDSHRGGRRDLDGSDELDEHLEALEEVELGDLFRTHQASGSLLRMDLDLGAEAADLTDPGARRGIAYDEWDGRRRAYRKAWCTVYPTDAPLGDPAWATAVLRPHRALLRRLRLRLAAQRAGLRPASRQLDGEDIDLAAALDDRADRRAGRGGDPRLYVRALRRRRDFATLVLIDVSMSTDSWIQGRRVLDVAREATLALGEVADDLGDRLQVLAFASETRNRCYVWKVLGDGEPWSTGRRRLAALEPRGYTRIGPALRHATATLAATPAEKRLLLLISDAKPTDYDRYEGRYGVADVRQALREAREHEIHTHALAVDAVARDTMPALFGPGGFHVLPKPEDLLEALTAVYGRLTAR